MVLFAVHNIYSNKHFLFSKMQLESGKNHHWMKCNAHYYVVLRGNQSISVFHFVSLPGHVYWVSVAESWAKRRGRTAVSLWIMTLTLQNLLTEIETNKNRSICSPLNPHTKDCVSRKLNSLCSIQTHNDRRNKSWFFTHSVALGLQKALVSAITIQVLPAISGRLAALTVLYKRVSRRWASRGTVCRYSASPSPSAPGQGWTRPLQRLRIPSIPLSLSHLC